MGDPRPKHKAIREAAVEYDGQTIWQAMSVLELSDGLDLHPLIVGLIFELPLSPDEAMWTPNRKYRWLKLCEGVLDCLYTVQREPPVTANPDEAEMGREARLDAQIAELKATLADERRALGDERRRRDALTAERGNLKLTVEDLQKRLDAALGDLAEASAQKPPTPPVGKRTLPSGHVDPPVRMEKQPTSRLLCGARSRLNEWSCVLGPDHDGDHQDALGHRWAVISESSERLLRTAGEVAGEPAAADAVIRNGKGRVTLSAAHGAVPDDDDGSTGVCRVDHCTEAAHMRGRWAGICQNHREILLRTGSTVLIDGEHHVLIPGQGGGKVRPKAEVDA